MKVAIVKGGFEGVRTQHKRWVLERRVEEQRRRIESCERNLIAERSKLTNLIVERDATPTFEMQ